MFMKTSTGYIKISKFLRNFGGNSKQVTPAQSIIETAGVAHPSVHEKVQAKRPRLKSASKPAPSKLGDFKSSHHPAGINLRALTGPCAPHQFAKDAPLSAVFSRLMAQPAATNIPEQNLRSMLGLVK
jgi:hypothetical protein